jgi:hypothetical protein
VLDTAHAAAVQELKADVEGKLRKAREDKQALEKSMQDMHEDEERAWKEKLRVIDRQFRKLLAAKEDELRDMEASLSELRKDRARRPRYRYQKQKAEHEDTEQERLVNDARREVSLARDAYQKFCTELAGNIFNGTANGLAAGIASGVITGGKLVLVLLVLNLLAISDKIRDANATSLCSYFYRTVYYNVTCS